MPSRYRLKELKSKDKTINKGNKMIKKVMTGLLSLVMLITIISCSDDDPVSSDSKNWFVVDTLGNPINGAKIVASYYREVFDSTGVIKTLQPGSRYGALPLGFGLDDTAQVDLIVKDYYTKDTVKVLIDIIMSPPVGFPLFHLVSWTRKNSDEKYVLNGVYESVLTFNDSLIRHKEHRVCYVYEGVEENELEYIAATDSDGRFSFNPLEHIIDYVGDYNISGITGEDRFTDYVQLWAVKDGYENACIDSFDLMGDNENIEIVLRVEGGIIIEE